MGKRVNLFLGNNPCNPISLGIVGHLKVYENFFLSFPTFLYILKDKEIFRYICQFFPIFPILGC
jgi:hypothetical protein